jgi:hypothetical protein
MSESNPSNPFAVAAAEAGAVVQVAQSKEAQQIQAQLVIAKKFPRDQNVAYQQIMEACKRKGLAEEASYLYARGGTQVTGPSIRLMEVIAQCWGNFRAGVIELDQADGESRMEAFAWDFQTNTYFSKSFSVRHERYTKEFGNQKLTDPRDVYEHTANFAARRQRSCMEAVIPKDIIDDALEQCDKTLKSGHTEPLVDRVRKMVGLFAEHGVSVEMIEKRLQHKLSAVIEQEMVLLRKIYTALRDGMGKREDYFDVSAAGAAPKPAKIEKKEPAKEAKEPAKEPAKEEEALAAAGLAPEKQAAAAAAPDTPPAATPAAPPAAASEISNLKSQISEEPAAKSMDDLFKGAGAPPPSLAEQALALLGPNKVTEEEVLNVLKARSICAAAVKSFTELSDVILKDLVGNMEIIAAQVRIDKKGRKK